MAYYTARSLQKLQTFIIYSESRNAANIQNYFLHYFGMLRYFI